MTVPTERFHTARFAKTSEARRNAVLDTAIEQFATHGYAATSINDIAREANVSIGAMYSYFTSKEDLFLTVINSAYALMDSILHRVADESQDVYDYVGRMLVACREFAHEHSSLNQLYLSITSQAGAELSVRLSDTIESVTPEILTGLIDRGKQAGIVRAEVDARMWALCIDDLFMMYQFSFASDYYRQRLRVYLGTDAADETAVENGVLSFIRAALQGPTGHPVTNRARP